MKPLVARKRFGQNFLEDPLVINNIIDAIAPKPSDHMVEIGPGLGALTRELLPRVEKLNVIEIDRDLIPKLRTQWGSLGHLAIHEADILKFDLSTLTSTAQSMRIVGNLPYNITTPVLFYLLDYLPLIKDMYFMLQKEVVDRLSATPNNKQYGRLSILLQYHCQIDGLFTVPPEAFNPAPKVTSAVVRLIPYTSPPYRSHHPALFKQIVANAFNYRRKTLHNSLKGLLSDEQLNQAGISPNLRAEQLSVSDFVRLSNIESP